MYINNLGMRDEITHYDAANANTIKNRKTNTSNNASFPTAIKQAVESQSAAYGENSALTQKVEEALEHLKSDPEWQDVGTALSALYQNQQQMQVKMNLMSAGVTGSLTGLSAYSGYGSANQLTVAYGGISSLLGSSLLGSQLI
ncbi:MAG: hypothetical protein NC419_10560 [Muribaculaceae bacterium]|nr:hypothetical protein [Muribaculaceae bacterium]